MTTNIPESPNSVAQLARAQDLKGLNEDKSRSSGVEGVVLEGSSDDIHWPALRFTITIPKWVQRSISIISPTLDESAWHHLVPIAIVICVEVVFLKWIRRSGEDVLSAIFFTFLLGSFAWPVWSDLKRMQSRLGGVSGRVESLQRSVKSLQSPRASAVHPAVEHVTTVPAEPNIPPSFPKEYSPRKRASKRVAKRMAKSVDPELERPVEPQVATRRLYLPYEISPTSEPVTPPVVIQSSPPFVSSVTSDLDAGTGVEIEGLMDNILGEVEIGTAGVSAEQYRSQPTPTPELAFGRRFPALREIKQRIEQLTEGRLEMTPHSDQSESSNLVSLRRCGVRLLMSVASLDPADFASPVGFFGPSESTPYYPTGDLQRDRGLAHVIAIGRLEELQGNLHGIEDVRIANKLVELAQALNDLGLHDYALNTSGYALDTLEHQPDAAPNSTRLHLASVLSLRANILCDLKRNDEAIRAADRAVSLYREHRDSQTAPVPELAYALLDYAILLGSIGQKGKAAEVAFELLLGEVDETRPDIQDISALCNLCLANARIGDDDDTALSMAEEAIELTLTSSDASSQPVLIGALLNKSKILSSRGQSEAALSFSDQAVTLLRRISSARPVFSLFLAHALDIHSHNLSDANRKGDAYSIVQEAVMLWQTLKASAPGPIARPLAGALFQLAKFRHRGDKRNALREDLRIAKSAVDMFREIIPPDAPGLADALYLYADRMLELGETREAAACAEESIQHFRKAVSEDRKYSLDLIFSLSLASSCLARTERAEDAFEYAKQAVEVQHGRKGAKDAQFEAHLRKLLMDVVVRATEIGKEAEGVPWIQELQALTVPEDKYANSLARRSGKPQGKSKKFKKETSYWIDENMNAPRSNSGPTTSAAMTSRSTPGIDKGKGKEVAPSPEVGSSTLRIDGRKADEVKPPFNSSARRHRLTDENVLSPAAVVAAAAQRRLAGPGNTGLPLGNLLGGGSGSHDMLSGLLSIGSALGLGGPAMGSGMGGRTLGGTGGRTFGGGGSGTTPNLGTGRLGAEGGQGGPGSVNLTGGGRLRGLGGLGGSEMGGLESLGASINGLAEGLLGSLGRLGPDLFEQGGDNSTGTNTNSGNDTEDGGAPGGANSQSSSTTRTGI